jgi:uncharacterized protein HemY
MSAKSNRQHQRTAKKLASELKDNARLPGFLGRLCRLEQMWQRPGLFTLQHRRD